MPVLVLVLNPEGGEGGCLQLEARTYLIGRREGSDIELDSPTVSREHARIYPAGGEWILEDAGSRNGISLNGKRVQSTPLQEGDLFSIGPVTVFFFTESSLSEIEELQQNFPRLKEMALAYTVQLALESEPQMEPSEKVPLVKAKASGFSLGKNLTLLSDIASGKLSKRP